MRRDTIVRAAGRAKRTDRPDIFPRNARLAAGFLPGRMTALDPPMAAGQRPPTDPAVLPPGDDAQDVAWMRRVQAGDMDAFAALVEAHQGRVIGTVARMLGTDPADAEDLAQQVFVRIWKSAARWEPSAKFTTWLFTITRNLVFNETRRRGRHRHVVSLDAPAPGGDGTEGPARDPADERARGPDAALLDQEMQDAVDAAIAELPEQQRLAVLLRRHEEMPYEDIALVLEITVPAVKSLLFRARTVLRERLDRYLSR